MDLQTAKQRMSCIGLTITSEVDLNNGNGTQLRTAEGPILDVYKSGKCVAGGKQQQLLKPILEGQAERYVEGAACEIDRLRRLEAENLQLKKLLAERDLLIDELNAARRR